FAGHFPVWLDPEQVRVLTISEKADDFAREVYQQLRNQGVRATLVNNSDKIGAKIRNAQLDKLPYMFVVGEKEAAVKSVAVRHSKKGDLGVHDIETYLPELLKAIQEPSL